MALFFDQTWFTEQLKRVGRTPNDLAQAMGIELIDLAAVWKDQRELSPAEVRAMAAVLRQPVAEVASRAGISTPVPDAPPGGSSEGDGSGGGNADLSAILARLDELSARLDRLERAVADVKALALDMRAGAGTPTERT